MPTRRMIEPSIWQSESMGRLSIRQRLMFIGMFSNADDQGRLRASAPVIRSMIFPFDDITLADIEDDILAIEREKCIMLYEVDGPRYAQVINWWKYQKHQWAYPSLIPKADGWTDSLRFRQKNEVITENWDTKKPSIDQNRIEVPKGLGKDLPKENASDDAPEPEKKHRKRSDRDIASETLEQYFVSLSGLPAPKWDTDAQRKASARLWKNPLLEIWELCGKDLSKAQAIIEKAYRQMGELTVSDPNSIIKVARSVYAKNGFHNHAAADSMKGYTKV